MTENNTPDPNYDAGYRARWVQVVERLKALGYTPWLGADELDAFKSRELLREYEAFAAHLAARGY